MKTSLTFLLITAVSLVSVAGATEPRTEDRHYVFATTTGDCGSFQGASTVVCIPVYSGEVSVRVQVSEESPAKMLNEHVGVVAVFPGTLAPARTFCDERTISIPTGASVLRLQIASGTVSGFCPEVDDSINAALRGSVTATFT